MQLSLNKAKKFRVTKISIKLKFQLNLFNIEWSERNGSLNLNTWFVSNFHSLFLKFSLCSISSANEKFVFDEFRCHFQHLKGYTPSRARIVASLTFVWPASDFRLVLHSQLFLIISGKIVWFAHIRIFLRIKWSE